MSTTAATGTMTADDLLVVVDPRTGTVTSYRSRTEIRMLSGDDVLAGGDAVPGWKLPVRDLFR